MQLSPISNLNPNFKIYKTKQIAKTHNSLTTFAATNPIAKLKPYHLSSKYNINFAGLNNEEPFDFDKAAQELENNIETKLNPPDFDITEIKSAIKSSADIKLINSILKEDGITDFSKSGVSLNRTLGYLKRKGQIIFPKKVLPKEAFFVEDLSVGYLERYKAIDEFLIKEHTDKVSGGRTKFYAYNVEPQKLAELQKRLEKALHHKIDIKEIAGEAQKETLYPKAQDIKNILNDMAIEVPEDKQEEFKRIALKYLDSTLACYSYQTLARQLKQAYRQIEKYALFQNKTMDDVLYYIPESSKSYEVINYLYAAENDIDPKKFVYNRRIGGSRDKNSIFVILDDCALSGDSMTKAANLFGTSSYFRNFDFDLVFCPIISTDEAAMKAKNLSKLRLFHFLPIDTCRIYDIHENENGLLKDGFSLDEINILIDNVPRGYGDQFASIVFPYMIPDNSSELVGLLGGKFLIFDDAISANKAMGVQIAKFV